MAKFVRKFTKRIFMVSNIILVALFLLACLSPVLNPKTWWFIAVLGLGFPFLLVLLIGFMVFWLIFRSRWVYLPLIALLLSYFNIRALIGFHFAAPYTSKKDSTAIRVLTWNVSWFGEQRQRSGTYKPKRKDMLAFIASQNADILCFQEFLESNKEKRTVSYSNMNDLAELGYKYNYWSKDYATAWGAFHAGPAIVSRYPIIATYKINYTGPRQLRAAESLIAADIALGNDTVRVFTTHLQSILLMKDDYRNLEIIRNADDSIMEASKSILRKLRTGYQFRSTQAELVRKELDKSPFPEIICGDFNDVPTSYTYFTIKGNRQDVFLEKGAGIGRTYAEVAPTLRIDYILAGKAFEVKQVKSVKTAYSDHYPVLTDLTLKAKEDRE